MASYAILSSNYFYNQFDSLILECQVSLHDIAKMVGDEVCFKNECMYLNSF